MTKTSLERDCPRGLSRGVPTIDRGLPNQTRLSVPIKTLPKLSCQQPTENCVLSFTGFQKCPLRLWVSYSEVFNLSYFSFQGSSFAPGWSIYIGPCLSPGCNMAWSLWDLTHFFLNFSSLRINIVSGNLFSFIFLFGYLSLVISFSQTVGITGCSDIFKNKALETLCI